MTADLLVELGQYDLAIKEHERFLKVNHNLLRNWEEQRHCVSDKEMAAIEVLVELTRQYPNSANG